MFTSKLTEPSEKTTFFTGCRLVTWQVAVALGLSWLMQVMVQLPGPTGVILPEEFTLTMLSSLETHVTFLLLALEGSTVAFSVL